MNRYIYSQALGYGGATRRRFRKGVDRAEDLRVFGEVFRKHDNCKKVGGRSKVTSIDGRYTWKDEVSLRALRKEGTAFLHNNHKNGFSLSVPNSVLLCKEDHEGVATASQDNFTEQSVQESAANVGDDGVEDGVDDSDDDDDDDDEDD